MHKVYVISTITPQIHRNRGINKRLLMCMAEGMGREPRTGVGGWAEG